MFGKDRALQVKLVNTKNKEMTDNENIEIKTVDPEQIVKIVTEYTVKTIGAIGAVIAANRVLKTTCEIAVIAARSKFK